MDENDTFDANAEIQINPADMWRGLFVGHQSSAVREGKKNTFQCIGNYLSECTNKYGDTIPLNIIIQPVIFDGTIKRTTVLNVRILNKETGEHLAYGGALTEWQHLMGDGDTPIEQLEPGFIQFNFGMTEVAEDMGMIFEDFYAILSDVAQTMDLPRDAIEEDDDDDGNIDDSFL